MWFWLAIIALLCWSGSDLFSKIGCRDGRDKYNPLKMVIAVGVVMGIHAAYEIFVGGAVVTWHVMWTYLPVSLLYIGSMTLGYVGLRYIELSISSPICNSSGALVAVLCLITGTLDESITGAMRWMVIGAVALVCIGVVGLGIVESREDDELRKKRQEGSNYKYAKSWLALCLPVAYCLLDAAGTFADSLVLRTLNEDSANCAYELTFLAAAVICFIYVVIIKKDKLVFKAEAPKYAGALFETAGQFAYIYALADEAHVALSAPIISAYCVASVLWSRIFLKEKLNIKGVLCIAAVVVGMLFIVGIVTPEGLTLDLDPKYTFGNAIAFASGVAYGLYLFFSRYREDCDSNVRSWWNFLFGSLSIVVLLVWHHFFLQPLSYTEKINGVTQFDASGQIITHAWNMFTMPGSSWVVLIAAALITGFGAFYLLTHATKRLKAGELAAISYQETIMASLLGLFMFGETMTTFQIIGGALIVCGGVAQIFFSTAAASKQGEKIEKEEEIRENLEARLDQEQEREALS